MKKTFLFIFSFCLIFSLLCLSCFASGSFVPTDATNTVWLMNDSPYTSGSFTWNITFYSFGYKFTSLYISPDGCFYFFNPATSSRIQVYSSSTGWVNDEYKTIYIVGGPGASLTSSINAFANNYASFVRYDDSPNASEGVSASIGFVGQVLNFITSSSGILALLGLSVAMFLLVPFSIRKIKQFVKGY